MIKKAILLFFVIAVTTLHSNAQCSVPPPVLSDTLIELCKYDSLITISAEGEGEIRWYVYIETRDMVSYYDIGDTIQISPRNFNTGTYYCYQVIDSCESDRVELQIILQDTSARPQLIPPSLTYAFEYAVCNLNINDQTLTVSNLHNYNTLWYKSDYIEYSEFDLPLDQDLDLIYTGDSLDLRNRFGAYTYFATYENTETGCTTPFSNAYTIDILDSIFQLPREYLIDEETDTWMNIRINDSIRTCSDNARIDDISMNRVNRTVFWDSLAMDTLYSDQANMSLPFYFNLSYGDNTIYFDISKHGCKSERYYRTYHRDSIVQQPIITGQSYFSQGESVQLTANNSFNYQFSWYTGINEEINFGTQYRTNPFETGQLFGETDTVFCARASAEVCESSTSCHTLRPALNYPHIIDRNLFMVLGNSVPSFEIEGRDSLSVQWIDESGNIVDTSMIFTPTVSGTGEYEYQVYIALSENEYIPYGLVKLTVIESGIYGRVYVDENENGRQDMGETGLANKTIYISPGYHYCITDAYGNYFYECDSGTYRIRVPLQFPYSAIVSSDTTVELVNNTVEIDFKIKRNDDVAELSVTNTSTRARPGFSAILNVNYSNIGIDAEETTLVVELDSIITFDYTNITPDNISGNILTWNLGTVSDGRETIDIHYNVPANVDLLGEELIFSSSITSETEDYDLSNNTYASAREITGSYDPNDKQVAPSYGNEGYVLFDTTLYYTIRFQNEGNDTAFTVTIVDTLDHNLNISTFELQTSSHNVDIELIDSIITFTFNEILLPDKTTNEDESMGYLIYSILPNTNLAENTIVNNTAHIIFDFNPAVETNTTISTFVSEIPYDTNIERINKTKTISITPNPAHDNLFVNGNISNDYSIRDITGKEIVQGIVTAQNIDIRKLRKGVYYLIIDNISVQFIKE